MITQFKLPSGNYIGHAALVSGDYVGEGPLGVANQTSLISDCRSALEGIDMDKHHGLLGINKGPYTIDWSYIHGPDKDGVFNWQEFWLDEWHKQFTPADRPIILWLCGGYGSQQVILRLPDDDDTQEVREELNTLQATLRGLDDYPVFDEELMSEVESDWEEAWFSDCGWTDLKAAILKAGAVDGLPTDHLEERLDGFTDDEAWQIYRDAMTNENGEVHYEYASAYVDVDALAQAGLDALPEPE